MSDKMYELKELMRKELDKIASKGTLSAGDLEAAHKLTDTIKNIDKIDMLEGGYSQTGDWETDMRGSYGRGNSYARSYVRGHYRDNGGYSQTDGYSRGSLAEHLEDMLREARTDREKDAIRQCMNSLR